jgi:HK97 family phage major capsid protein
MDMALIELREELDDSLAVYQAARDAIDAAGEDADLDSLEATFNDAEERYTKARKDHQTATDRQERARKRFELHERAKDAGKLVEDPTPTRGEVKVGKEPLTYRRNGEFSVFKDLYRAAGANGFPDQAAAERLNRHMREMEFERGIKIGDLPRDAQFDLSSTDSAGGYLVAPLWLQEEFVNLARAGRVVADALGPRPLPPNTDSINLPRMSAGTTVTTIADNAAVSETDATFDTISGDVKTTAGLQDVSQQLVDRGVPGIDEVIFADLAKAYAVLFDQSVINSSTSNNKGLLQVTGVNAITYTAATPTVAQLYSKIADGVRQIHEGIFMPPTAIFMAPRRWASLLAAADTVGRPLITPIAPQNSVAGFGGVVSQGLVGSMQGLPVYVDANIPQTLGAGTNEDRVIVVRDDECFLYEESSGPFLETFRDVGSGNLTVRFRLHNYWAQINERRPKAISVISGTGLVAPTF